MVKHTQTIRHLLATNCLGMFDHFVGMALKGLIHYQTSMKEFLSKWLMASKFQLFLQKFRHRCLAPRS